MKNRIFLTSLLSGSMVLGSATLFAQELANDQNGGAQEPPRAGIHWAKGEGNGQGNGNGADNGNKTGQAGRGGGVKLLMWFGGPVQHGTTTVTPIFWGTSWSNSAGDKIDGMKSFYTDVSGTSYASTNTEYTDTAGHVSPLVALNLNPAGGTYIDSSQAAKSGQSTSAILAEVCKVYPTPIQGGYYPVYVDQPRGTAGYCAWHSAGSCNGIPIQFGFFFNMDGDAGCDPGGSTGSYAKGKTNSQGLAAIANVSGHELSEMLTDPNLHAWFDRSGAENADKCAWTFGSSLLTFANGSTWKVQGNWSNAAYNASQGYIDGMTKIRGCIDGTN